MVFNGEVFNYREVASWWYSNLDYVRFRSNPGVFCSKRNRRRQRLQWHVHHRHLGHPRPELHLDPRPFLA